MTIPSTPIAPTSEQADGLLPCPVCSGRCEIMRGVMTKYVMCRKCELMGPNLSRDEELIAHWNTRTPQPQEAPAPVRADAWISPLVAAKSVVIDDDIVQVACDAFDYETSPHECVYGSDAMRAGIDAALGALLARGVISPTSAPAPVRAVEASDSLLIEYMFTLYEGNGSRDTDAMWDAMSTDHQHLARIFDKGLSASLDVPTDTRRVAGGEICHCTCHNDPLYCRECKECSCHTK